MVSPTRLSLLLLTLSALAPVPGGARADLPVVDQLRLHLDASDIDAGGDASAGDPAPGEAVASWGDRARRTGALTAGALAPRLVAGAIGGRRAVAFSAGDDVLERRGILDGQSGNPPLEIFVVLDSDDEAPFFALGTGAGGQTKALDGQAGILFGNGSRLFAGAPLGGQGPVIGNFAAPENAVYSAHRFARNGQEATASSTERPSGWTIFPTSGGVTRIGAGVGAEESTDGDFRGRIAELIVYSRELTSFERTLVLNYLQARYAIPLAPASLDLYSGDEPARGDRDEDLVGIGRDAASTVTSAFSAGLELLDRGFVSEVGDSLLAAHAAPVCAWTTDDVAGIPTVATRVSRDWHVDVRDAGAGGGAIDLAFDLVTMGLGRPRVDQTYALLLRARPGEAFTAAEASATLDGDRVHFESLPVSLLDDRLITLGTSERAPSVATVVISEAVASNVLGLDDFQGDSVDWIEIHNVSPSTVSLEGWFLSDDEGDEREWAFPPGTSLAADERLIVFASGKDLAEPELHTSFQISSGGEVLTLADEDGIVDSLALPPQLRDVAYGLPGTGGAATFLAEPTPGAPNSGPASLGPRVIAPTHVPRAPSSSDAISVIARIEALDAPVAAARLVYRTLYDAESTVPMRDDGADGDAVAADGLFTARIPATAFGPGDMVRWRIIAEDTDGDLTIEPPFPSATSSPEYHGVVVADPSIDTGVPVFHWFLRPGTEGAAATRSGTRATVAFGGELYDNVFCRVRGGSTAGLAKKSYKFDFNPGHHFRFAADTGRVSEINLNTTYTDKAYVRQPLAYAIYDAAGAAGCECEVWRVQRNGEFYMLTAFTEQVDDDLLRREGLDPDGALYKVFTNFSSAGNVEKKTRRWEGNADINSFASSLNSLSGERLRDYVFDNVDVPAALDYLAANALTQNCDSMAKNYYVYRDTDGDAEWRILPWDVDLTFGRHFMTDDSILGDLLWADEDRVLGGRNRDVPVSPSHPFMGIQELPGNRNWNRLIDALFEVDDFRAMFRRRLRTLMDEVLEAPETPPAERLLEAWLADRATLLGGDAVLDVARWGQFGQRMTLLEAVGILERDYLDVHRAHLFDTHLDANSASYDGGAFSAELPSEQLDSFPLEIASLEFAPASGDQDEEYVEIRNPNALAVDISGYELSEAVSHTFEPGTVLLPGASVFVSPKVRSFRGRSESPTGGEGLFVQGPYSGHLSSLGETLVLTSPDGSEVDRVSYEGDPSDAQRYLRITEIHYHPADPDARELAAGVLDDDDFEFIELRNISESVTLDLSGIRLTRGVAFDFATGALTTLAPGELALVVRDRAAFELRYGIGLPIAGEYGPDRLDNGGERIQLEDALDGTIAEIRYDDDPTLGWPALADGAGPSLELVSLDADPELAASWRASEVIGGTPGDRPGTTGERFVRGDSNLNGLIDLSDAITILLYLFQGGQSTCLDAADVDDDEEINLTDPIRLLDFLFQGGPTPEAPWPAPGLDPTDDGALDCIRGL